MAVTSDDALRDLTAHCEHEKYVTAIQSLLFLGNMSVMNEEHGLHNMLKQKSYPDVPAWSDGTQRGNSKRNPKNCVDSITPQRATPSKGKSCPLLLVNDIHGGCTEVITEDLSNALLSTTLVLASVSKSKKWPLLNTISDVNIPAKRRRNSSTSLRCEAETPVKQEGDRGGEISNSSCNREVRDLPAEKKRKSNADRYRERNSRRKQFFGNKLVRLIDLLRKYKLMISAEVISLYSAHLIISNILYQLHLAKVHLLFYHSRDLYQTRILSWRCHSLHG